MKLCWLDIRECAELAPAVCAEAVHQRIDAIVAADPAELAGLPPTVTKVLMPPGGRMPDSLGDAQVVVVDAHGVEAAQPPAGVHLGSYVEVHDPDSLDLACRAARRDEWCVIRFRDPTRIPLEIVLAAADGAEGHIITAVDSVDEAAIAFGVLERGSDGVLLAPSAVGDATRLRAAASPAMDDLELVELVVTGIRHVGMGERACVDTCTLLHPDEGILVGSHARGLLLCASETHPLPYMPTRPFRVNAGAVMSYTLGNSGRTRYLSELHTGDTVLAVDAKGRVRPVTVGRTKIESRPLLSIETAAADGRTVSAIVQDDWHVRVLGPGGTVLNSTALCPGDVVLGHVPGRDRHVGYPIDELCYEQ